MIGVNEVEEMLGVAESKAYEIIRNLNKELNREGYLTVRGRVPESYLKKRYKLDE